MFAITDIVKASVNTTLVAISRVSLAIEQNVTMLGNIPARASSSIIRSMPAFSIASKTPAVSGANIATVNTRASKGGTSQGSDASPEEKTAYAAIKRKSQ
jgi:hypothetical protein